MHLQVLENKFQQEEIKSHGYLLKRFKQIDNEAWAFPKTKFKDLDFLPICR